MMFLATTPNPDELRSALACVPARDRELWLRMGMAVKAALGDAGFPIWNDWSRSAVSYREKDAQAVWRSITSGAVGIGSLFYTARQYGWRGECGELTPLTPRKAPESHKSNTRAYALRCWLAADRTDDAVASHPYAQAKGIDWTAGAGRGRVSGRVVGQDADCLIVPIHDMATNKIQGIQAINPAGDKQTFGEVSGNGLIIGNTLDRESVWVVCEGWASAASWVFHHKKGNAAAAISFGKHNQRKLAERIMEVFQPKAVCIFEEQD